MDAGEVDAGGGPHRREVVVEVEAQGLDQVGVGLAVDLPAYFQQINRRELTKVH